MRSSTAYRLWLSSWLGLLLLAVLNGTVRGTVLQPRLGEERRHPIPDAKHAWVVGMSWAVMTLGFVRAGRLWVLVPLRTAVAPEVMLRLTLSQAPGEPETR